MIEKILVATRNKSKMAELVERDKHSNSDNEATNAVEDLIHDISQILFKRDWMR